MSADAGMIRQSPCWIESFLEKTAELPSPRLFRKWAAISTVAGALERKVWLRSSRMILYPNLYVLLVGPPAVGKTVSLSQTEALWRSTQDLHVAPNSLTKASLVDALADSTRKIVRMDKNPPFYEFHSLLIASREFGVLVPQYEQDFMNHLNDLYDCGPVFEERRRSIKDNAKIINPQVNLIGGTTPSFLQGFLPEGAWDQGFMSRMILAYSGEVITTDLGLMEDEENVKLDTANLELDLKIISKLFGKVSWTQEAADRISNWRKSGCSPVPEHRKLLHYNGRRILHLLKLCVVSCTSRNNSLLIEECDYERAIDWLVEVEAYMPDIFKDMANGGDSQAIDDTWFYVYQTWAKEKKPIAEHRIVYFLKDRVPSHSVMRVLEMMVRSNLLQDSMDPTNGRKVYVPRAKDTHGT